MVRISSPQPMRSHRALERGVFGVVFVVELDGPRLVQAAGDRLGELDRLGRRRPNRAPASWPSIGRRQFVERQRRPRSQPANSCSLMQRRRQRVSRVHGASAASKFDRRPAPGPVSVILAPHGRLNRHDRPAGVDAQRAMHLHAQAGKVRRIPGGPAIAPSRVMSPATARITSTSRANCRSTSSLRRRGQHSVPWSSARPCRSAKLRPAARSRPGPAPPDASVSESCGTSGALVSRRIMSSS